jgi:hypothetical protein
MFRPRVPPATVRDGRGKDLPGALDGETKVTTVRFDTLFKEEHIYAIKIGTSRL